MQIIKWLKGKGIGISTLSRNLLYSSIYQLVLYFFRCELKTGTAEKIQYVFPEQVDI